MDTVHSLKLSSRLSMNSNSVSSIRNYTLPVNRSFPKILYNIIYYDINEPSGRLPAAKRKYRRIHGGDMDSRTKKEIIGVGLIGTAVALGVAYANRKKIKRGYEVKKHNILTWKDKATLNALQKTENKEKDLKDKTLSVREIAW